MSSDLRPGGTARYFLRVKTSAQNTEQEEYDREREVDVGPKTYHRGKLAKW